MSSSLLCVFASTRLLSKAKNKSMIHGCPTEHLLAHGIVPLQRTNIHQHCPTGIRYIRSILTSIQSTRQVLKVKHHFNMGRFPINDHFESKNETIILIAELFIIPKYIIIYVNKCILFTHSNQVSTVPHSNVSC